MKKISEIEFIKNSNIDVPVAISHCDIDIDYMTSDSSCKSFTEYMAVEIAGESYVFVSKKNEIWSYISEGSGLSSMLSNSHNYIMSSPMLNDSRNVHVRDLDHERMMGKLDIDEWNKSEFHGRFSWHRRKIIKPFLYYVINDNNNHNELDNLFEIALIANIATFTDRSYVARWDKVDEWKDRSEFNTKDINQRIDSLTSQLLGKPYGMLVKLPMSAYNYDLLRDHIIAINPHFDMRIIDGFQVARKNIDKFNKQKEADQLIETLLDVMSKLDKQNQVQMLSVINKSSTSITTNFIKNSYERIFCELKEKAYAESTM
ncbi:hypothetical protein [Aliivibrio fischeri]|uniref:hypothetical protein n=1 Tax=Aliivibrio fischeri TaxID=668 RepID=UPI0007C49C8E|nr:hypothetical protein [Aliivibrio fischeri]